MAFPPCMSEDGNASVFVGTFLETGDAVSLCGECLPPFLVTVLASMTDTSPDTIAALVYGGPSYTATAEGVPTDEPPAPQPADVDHEAEGVDDGEGQAAPWVQNEEPPPGSGRAAGRSRSGRSSAAAGTGGGKAGGSE